MPDNDPLAPGWRPEYAGRDPALGDAGSGTTLGVRCYRLYAAGHNELPRVAATYSDLTLLDGVAAETFWLPGG